MGATCAMGLHAAGWNRVPRAQLAPETVDERVAWVIARARALGVPFLWDIGPSMRPLDLGGHLLRHGFSDEGEEPAMGVALANLPETLPLHDGVTIERVSDRAAQEQWVRTSCEGFGMPPSAVEPEVAAMAHDSLGDDAAAHYYLARLHGEPVATSALTLAAGVAGIFAVSTLEAARGRGIGTAVTLAPLLDARSRGYSVSASCRPARWATPSMRGWASRSSSAIVCIAGRRNVASERLELPPSALASQCGGRRSASPRRRASRP